MQCSRCSRQVGEKKQAQEEEREGRGYCRKRQAGTEKKERVKGGEGEEEEEQEEEDGASEEKQEKEGTSIFRPSTIVPFSFSRARSASALVSNVTNPKPCSGKEVGLEEPSGGGKEVQG